jgi:hypothetical protein
VTGEEPVAEPKWGRPAAGREPAAAALLAWMAVPDAASRPYRDKKPFRVSPSPDNPRVKSRRLEPDEVSDLAYATQLARYAREDYSGRNYAAARYIDANGEPFILISQSKGTHSERIIGYPILKDGNPAGLQAVYTERQPCQSTFMV